MRLPLLAALILVSAPALALETGAPDARDGWTVSLGGGASLGFDAWRSEPADAPGGLRFGAVARGAAPRGPSDSDAVPGLSGAERGRAAGLVLEYAWPSYRVGTELRQGVQDGVVLDFGADYVARLGDRLNLSIGPRVSLGADDASLGAFAITPPARPGAPFGADSAAAGLAGGATYRLSDSMGVGAFAQYGRLFGGPAGAPNEAAQSQGLFGLTFTYRLGL